VPSAAPTLCASLKNEKLGTDKIYIKLLDGTIAWIPVDAERIAENQYKILEDDEFKVDDNPLHLHEFYPEDIVETDFQTFTEGKKVKIAIEILSKGSWPCKLPSN
jgi:hypothetical protein